MEAKARPRQVSRPAGASKAAALPSAPAGDGAADREGADPVSETPTASPEGKALEGAAPDGEAPAKAIPEERVPDEGVPKEAASERFVGGRLLGSLLAVRRSEVAALAYAWLYIFSVLMSYYIMRPIRDEMGVAGGVRYLPWLFTGTLVAMIALNVPFAALVRALPRVSFIAVTYRFFAANILAFALALWLAGPTQTVWVGRAFFIWISVFNLFVVSVFWAMIVDTFDSEQGRRLFGFIAAGATLGALVGSAVVVGLAGHVPQTALLVAAAVLLEVAVIGVRRLSAQSATMPRADRAGTDRAGAADERVGGSVWAGFRQTFASPYLLNTALFLLLFSVTSTLLYFEVTGAAAATYRDRAARTEFFAQIDLAVNVLTLVLQVFATGPILRRAGVMLTLALLPAASVVGFGVVALLPSVAAIVAFQVLRRAGNFAIARPTREILYTVVPREDRYKAKSFIDTVVYRLGDQLGAWSTEFLHGHGGHGGIGHGAIALAAIPLSLAWLVGSLWLGKRQETLARAQQAPAAAQPSPSK